MFNSTTDQPKKNKSDLLKYYHIFAKVFILLFRTVMLWSFIYFFFFFAIIQQEQYCNYSCFQQCFFWQFQSIHFLSVHSDRPSSTHSQYLYCPFAWHLNCLCWVFWNVSFFFLYLPFPSASNPCEENDGRGPCSHLCLISYNRTASCTCPHLMKLSPNKQSCFGERGHHPHFSCFLLLLSEWKYSILCKQDRCFSSHMNFFWLTSAFTPCCCYHTLTWIWQESFTFSNDWFPNHLTSVEKVPPVCAAVWNPWRGHWQPLFERNDGANSARHRWCHSGGLRCPGGEDLLGWHQNPNHQTGLHQWHPARDHHFCR